MKSKQQMLSSGKFWQTTTSPAGDAASLPDARSLLVSIFPSFTKCFSA
ncbi:MAG: hypothetical protein ACYTXA_07690 [Nostoc sp.]